MTRDWPPLMPTAQLGLFGDLRPMPQRARFASIPEFPPVLVWLKSWGGNVPCRVYFVVGRSSGLLKIGSSTDPYKRISKMQTATTEDLLLLGWVPGGEPLEKYLHERLHKSRVRGEWFRQTPAVIFAVRTLLERYARELREGR